MPFITITDTAADGTTPVMIDPNEVGLWQLLFNETGQGQVYAAPLEGESEYPYAIDGNGTLFQASATKGLCGKSVSCISGSRVQANQKIVLPGPDAFGRYLYNNTNWDVPRNPCVVQELKAVLA